MNISSLQNKVSASSVPIERVADNAALSQTQKVGEVSRQFEAMLLRQVLQEAQKPVIKSKLNTDQSTRNSIYQDMLSNQMADSISKSGSFGLAHSLEQQFTRQLAATATPTGKTVHP